MKVEHSYTTLPPDQLMKVFAHCMAISVDLNIGGLPRLQLLSSFMDGLRAASGVVLLLCLSSPPVFLLACVCGIF